MISFANLLDFISKPFGFHFQFLWSSTFWFFPTCQVRVVRFYVCCPSLLPSFLPLLPSFFLLFASSSSSSQTSSPSSSPNVARCQHGPPGCSGQRRTSTASSRLQWAAPDLNRGALEPTGQRRTSPGELWSGLGNAGTHPGSPRAEWAAPDLSCQKICQKMCQKYVRKKCQMICQ